MTEIIVTDTSPIQMKDAPIIVIGMHRSGTTMICRLLEDLGLMTGKRKDENFEARFFHNINLWLFSQAGARWDDPKRFADLVRNGEARALAVDYVRTYLLRSPRSASFLGLQGYVKYRSVLSVDVPWGWKSPLNTFTLPIWLDIFPNARIIHIYRHGVDVANSLKVRNRKDMTRNWLQRAYYGFPPFHWVAPKQGTFMDSVRCDSLEGGLGLWEEYMAEAKNQVGMLGQRAVEVKYEDFLADPLPVLADLVDFCHLAADRSAVKNAAQQVKLERAFAYRKNPLLKELAEREAHRLAAQHY
jgi:hypothetical protein